ncbi:MAG: transglycosylase domain-containing protein [Bacteroidota bacterium]
MKYKLRLNYAFRKTLFIGLLALISTPFLIYYAAFWWFNTNEDRTLSEAQKEWLVKEMKNMPPLPENIYRVLEKYSPGLYTENTWDYKFKKSLLGMSPEKCQCNELYLPFIPGERNSKKEWVPLGQRDVLIKLFLERNFTQKRCLTYRMNIGDFGRNAIGAREAADMFFGKTLETLTDREIVGLYIMLDAPTYYSPIANKERFEERVDVFMKREKLSTK